MLHRHRRRHRRHRAFGHPFGFWGGPRGRFFGPGELRLALLSLLADGPQHGYELMRQLEARSGGAYRASAGSVYPTLQQIEDEGLARSESLEGKRVYRLTPDGERLLRDEADAVREIWRRSEGVSDWSGLADPDLWELARPLKRLAQAVLRAVEGGDGDSGRIDAVRRVLERARRDLERLDGDEPREADAG
jgi:DNA-binding PadR family transcriptional regulator